MIDKEIAERDLSPSSSASSAQQPVLVIEKLVKRRERADVVFELHVERLTLNRGSFVAIVGSSGCGKSTLLDMLALVMQPSRWARFELHNSAGLVDVGKLWQENDESGLARIRAELLGYVLQTGGLLPFLTVRQNVLLPVAIKGDKMVGRDIMKLAHRIGIDQWLDTKPQYLSGGQRQRAAILRALVHEPEIVFADEPTAAVDEDRAASIVKDFDSLARDHETTIVVVTHDRDLVLPFADSVFTFELEKISDKETRSHCVCLPVERKRKTELPHFPQDRDSV